MFAGEDGEEFKTMAAQEELKNGDNNVGVTRPSNPGLHSHPADTLDPLLLRGHLTTVQVDL